MEENLLVGRGVMFYHVLKAVTYQGNGDKIKLPPSCFTELSEQAAFDKGPLHFRLSAINQASVSGRKDDQKHGTTHASVLEFTVEEDTSLIEVRYVWLPKGTHAKLKPNELGFSDIPNHTAVLETSLCQHATLSQDDVLTVNHGVLAYHLRVLELKPSSSVSVLETNIEVDIVGPDSASQRTNQHVLKRFILGTSECGIVEEGNYRYYKLSIEEETWVRISVKLWV
ncbi:ubiquitin fusion degradation UFD1 family protein [Actinidia rufa]|uniref:Ubiquitin fusion degradation UFD1 family protein n=1 Tax=Actinidia rufa TaxID=165716 RepID=A0A7J0DGS7_9ERIC|nr:ubiquitin fusion degradation UFD1 family protein [Actinidia rufa]